jgi:NADH:ubiquinone oxidoreductase subunit 6 (subunit J)
MDSPGIVIGFYMMAGLALGSGTLVFLARNLLHALAFLVISFLSMAGLFLTLSADFIAMAQILIYAGSISVLMVFAVMLTPLASRDNGNTIYVLPGLLAAGGIATFVGFLALDTSWSGPATDFTTTIDLIGNLLLGKYVLAFEIASILLLFALIGAIMLVQTSSSDQEGGEGR